MNLACLVDLVSNPELGGSVRYHAKTLLRLTEARTIIVALCFMILFTLFSPPVDAQKRQRAGAPGYEITSILGNSRLVIIASRDGIISTQYEEAADPKKPTRGAILRYSDGSLWGIDFANRKVIATNLAAQVRQLERFVQYAVSAVPAGRDPYRQGGFSGALRRLPDTDKIGSHQLLAYSLTENHRQWRLWYASDLLHPDARFMKSLESLSPLDQPSRPILKEILGKPLVRVEVRTAAGLWKTVLTTTSIRPVTVRSDSFKPPPRFKTAAYDSHQRIRAHTSNQPQVSATARSGAGPVMANAELYVVFWGPALNRTPASGAMIELFSSMNATLSKRYIEHLSQYGVDSAKIAGVYHRSGAPSRDVGNANFAAISALVYDIGFNENAPIFWWSIGGHDPLYAVFVTESEVNASSWGGYHFVAFSLTHLVLPFPLSLFAHDGIPWLIVKVPDEALMLPLQGLAQRVNCLRGSPVFPPDVCTAIRGINGDGGFDKATRMFGHELVEATTDPFPFFGWSDVFKQPAWTESELADICRNEPSTAVGQTVLATYWSNKHRACVPKAGPTLKIFEPQAGQVLAFVQNPIVVRGWAEDPIDGVLADHINWSVDETPVGAGSTISAGTLALGQHIVRATVRNIAGVEASETISIFISGQVPQVKIYAPADGASFGTDEVVVFRGGSPEHSVPLSNHMWTINGADLGNSPEFSKLITTEGDKVIRLSGADASGLTGSAAITIHVTAPTRKATVKITEPANNAAFTALTPAGNITDHSMPIKFTAQVTDSTGTLVPGTVRWESSLDGALGTGSSITVRLRGGPCGVGDHKITVTFTDAAGRTSTDTISVSVGQIC
jgi:hypothetical protein